MKILIVQSRDNIIYMTSHHGYVNNCKPKTNSDKRSANRLSCFNGFYTSKIDLWLFTELKRINLEVKHGGSGVHRI